MTDNADIKENLGFPSQCIFGITWHDASTRGWNQTAESYKMHMENSTPQRLWGFYDGVNYPTHCVWWRHMALSNLSLVEAMYTSYTHV